VEAAGVGPAGFVGHGCADDAKAVIFGVGEGCEGGGPGDVAVGRGVGQWLSYRKSTE
jgi:hypothetical protein